jgi:hypothetical protein
MIVIRFVFVLVVLGVLLSLGCVCTHVAFFIKSVGHIPLYGRCCCSLLWSELLDTHYLVVGVLSFLRCEL